MRHRFFRLKLDILFRMGANEAFKLSGTLTDVKYNYS